MLIKVFQYIVLFFYIYSIPLIGLPFGIGTRIILGGLGLMLLLYPGVKLIKFNGDFVKLGFLLLVLSAISIISTSINLTDDYQFVDYSISILLIFLASYFTFNFFLYRKSIQIEALFKILSEAIVLIVFLQSILAFIMFFSPPISNFLNSIQVYSELDEGKLDDLLDVRVIGFGIKFFAFGIVNGFALILITSLLRGENYSAKKRLYLWGAFIIIFSVGMMAARTTIIGFVLSLLIYFNPFGFRIRTNKANRLKLAAYTLALLFAVYVLYIFVFSSNDKFDKLFSFGFDLFINYFETGSTNSDSLKEMSEMYIWPTEIETYLIGDGRFMGTGYDYYYMGTDIGWVRLLYYFGIPGTLIYFLTHYFVLSRNANRFNVYKFTFWLLLLYFIILNFKGFSDILFLIIPYMFSLVGANNKNLTWKKV